MRPVPATLWIREPGLPRHNADDLSPLGRLAALGALDRFDLAPPTAADVFYVEELDDDGPWQSAGGNVGIEDVRREGVGRVGFEGGGDVGCEEAVESGGFEGGERVAWVEAREEGVGEVVLGRVEGFGREVGGEMREEVVVGEGHGMWVLELR